MDIREGQLVTYRCSYSGVDATFKDGTRKMLRGVVHGRVVRFTGDRISAVVEVGTADGPVRFKAMTATLELGWGKADYSGAAGAARYRRFVAFAGLI